MYCDSCSLSFTSTIFKDSIGYDGGNFYLMNTASLTLTSVTMTNGRARHWGGSIYAGGTGAASITI